MMLLSVLLLLNLLLLVYLVVLRLSSTSVHIGQLGELRTPVVQIRKILIL